MAGTKVGGKTAASTNLKRHGKDFYSKIGTKGGSKTMEQGCKPKGFAANRELARLAGSKGGKVRPTTKVSDRSRLKDLVLGK